MTSSKMPDCPGCGGNRTYAVGDGLWRCKTCSSEFDPEHDGDVTYGDPAKQVANKAERELRTKAKRKATHER